MEYAGSATRFDIGLVCGVLQLRSFLLVLLVEANEILSWRSGSGFKDRNNKVKNSGNGNFIDFMDVNDQVFFPPYLTSSL